MRGCSVAHVGKPHFSEGFDNFGRIHCKCFRAPTIFRLSEVALLEKSFFVEILVFTANLHVKTGFVRRLFLKALRLHVSGRVDKQGFKAVRLYGNVGIYSEFASSV